MNLKTLTVEDVHALTEDPTVFERGESLAYDGSITHYAEDAGGISARVNGNHGEYAVTVRDGEELETRCTCAHEEGTCKHVAAVLLRHLEHGSETSTGA